MRIVLFILLCALCFSCKVCRLTKEDLAWQPYKVGDSLVFESSKGEFDTVRIKAIGLNTGATDPLAIFPRKKQTLFIRERRNILEFDAADGGNYMEFKLRLGENKLKYPSVVQKTDSIHFNPLENNAYKIEAKEYYDNVKYIKFDLAYIYWSKQYGYVGLEFKRWI